MRHWALLAALAATRAFDAFGPPPDDPYDEEEDDDYLDGGGARDDPLSRATSAFNLAISAAAARGSDPHTTSLHRVANWNELTLSATFACAGEEQTSIIVFAEPPTESDMSIVKGWFR